MKINWLWFLLFSFAGPAWSFCVPGEGTRNAEWAGLIVFDEGVAQQTLTVPLFLLEDAEGNQLPVLVPIAQQQALPPGVRHALCQISCIGRVVQSGMCSNDTQTMNITGGQLDILDSQGGGYPSVLKGTLETSVGPISILSLFVESNDNWTGGSISYQQGNWMPQTVPWRVRD